MNTEQSLREEFQRVGYFMASWWRCGCDIETQVELVEVPHFGSNCIENNKAKEVKLIINNQRLDYVQVAALVAILATDWRTLEDAQRPRPSADGGKLIDVVRCRLCCPATHAQLHLKNDLSGTFNQLPITSDSEMTFLFIVESIIKRIEFRCRQIKWM